jgi:hypothetical protein
VERAGLRIGSNGTKRHAARHRRRPHPSAGANMSRLCAPKSPQTPRPHGSASSAARPTTARGGQSRSSACREPAKRRARAPRPKRGRNAQGLRTLASAADAPLQPTRVGASPIPSGPSERAAPKDASGRHVRIIRNPGDDLNGQTRRGVMVGRSVVSIAPQRKATAIAANALRERGTAPIRRANASLTGPRAGRAPRPARADHHGRTIRNPGIGPSGQMPQGVTVDRRSAASTAPPRKVTAIVEMAHSKRGTAPIRRTNASLTGLRAGRAPKPAKADRNDRTTRTAARAPTSSHPGQTGVTEIGRGAPVAARAAKAGRRAAARLRSGGLAHRGRDRRRAAARAGRRQNREARTGAFALIVPGPVARAVGFGVHECSPSPKGRPEGRPSLDGLWGEGRGEGPRTKRASTSAWLPHPAGQ